jgi:hypothetical protein
MRRQSPAILLIPVFNRFGNKEIQQSGKSTILLSNENNSIFLSIVAEWTGV